MSHDRGWLWAAAVTFILTRFVLLVALTPRWSDTQLYYQWSSQGFDQGRTVYRDFPLEYPPLAYWWMCLTRYLDEGPRQHGVDTMEAWLAYQDVYRVEMFFVDAATTVLLARILLRRRELAGPLLIGYVLATAVLGHLIYDRLDNVLSLLLAGWAACWVRSLEQDKYSAAWSRASYALLGLSVGFKLIPVLCIPFLLLADWTSGGWRRAAQSAAIVAAATVLPFALHWPSAGAKTLAFLAYHAERGIQIESIYGSLLAIGTLFGGGAQAVHGHGGWNIGGPGAAMLQTASTLLSGSLMIAGGGWALWRRRAFDRRVAYAASCVILVAATALSKVLSPQYFLWLVLLLALAASELLPPGRGWTWLFVGLVLVMSIATTWIFPYHYMSHWEGREVDPLGLIPALSWQPVAVLAVRNVVLATLTGWMIGGLLRRSSR